MESLPELVVLHIAKYLLPADCVRFSLTCKKLYSILPKYHQIRGKSFEITGPYDGHWAPELYFEGPNLKGKVRSFRATVAWKDQGFGNRKGRLMVKLVRNIEGRRTVIAENDNLFGIAHHGWTTPTCKLVSDPIVTFAEPGDFYCFERNAGGGGGHMLYVKDFTVLLELNMFQVK